VSETRTWPSTATKTINLPMFNNALLKGYHPFIYTSINSLTALIGPLIDGNECLFEFGDYKVGINRLQPPLVIDHTGHLTKT
jgi:hypothetical protein